ncbi:MAG: nucleoside deaminase [Chitinivibrionales bacterium]
MNQDHTFHMNRAYQEALKAYDEGEVPVGAVIVREGRIVGRGYNRVENLKDATAHAEIIAMSAASSSLASWRLHECSIYVTLEPCLMCVGAMLQARIQTIIYGAADNRMGAIETFRYRDIAQQSYNRFPETVGGVMADQCKMLLQSFFRDLRKKS